MHHEEPITESRTLSRRAAIGAGVAAAVAAPTALAASRRSLLTTDQLGWDAAAGEYTLPPLPYAYDALEPHIDAQTMEIHHSKHHAGYVRGLNRALRELAAARQAQDAGLVKHWSREVSFHGSGHVNHTLFWHSMKPAGEGGGGGPTGALAEAMRASFGSVEQGLWQFKAASRSVEASGWGWLVHDPVSGGLLVIQGEKQQDLMMTGVVPLLGLDVWEHAYYLRYQNRRADYVEAFMNVVDWEAVARRHAAATTP